MKRLAVLIIGVLLFAMPRLSFGSGAVSTFSCADASWGTLLTCSNTGTGPTVSVDTSSDWSSDVDYQISATDQSHSGDTITMTVSASASYSAFGQPMFLNSSGELDTANATDSTTAPALCLLAQSGTGSKKCVVSGVETRTAWSWTAGGIIYLSTDPSTNTGLTQTAPSGSGNIVQAIGVALSAHSIFVRPTMVTIEHN